MKTLTIPFPDDWHCHLRDGDYLKRTVPDIAQRFKRAIVMPNLSPPITTVVEAEQYRQRILQHLPAKNNFIPLMTLYLTDHTTPQEIRNAKSSDIVYAVKLYPAGATTHSQFGIQEIQKIYPVLEEMQKVNLPLLIHGEIPDDNIDIFDREKLFIEKKLIPLLRDFPQLRIVLEHVSTQFAVEFVLNAPNTLAATITAHHLLFNRNHLLAGCLRPHYYCLPILKTAQDQQALIKAATSGHQKFFLGTDSAPHTKNKKESCCGSAGIYSGHAAIEIYAQIFESHNALDQLEKFASINGARFYQLPMNTERLTLVKRPYAIPNDLAFGEEKLVPMLAGEKVAWEIQQ